MSKEVSLVVLSHGLWGVKKHMLYIEQKLQAKYGDSIYILNAGVNEAKYSYDGIDICGRRLAQEIESTVVRLGKNGTQVTRFSIIGYSLGGLITRYTIGLLAQRGFFGAIQPDYYVSFATPHLGVKGPSHSLFSSFFNFVSGRMVSRSGEQLQLIDKFEKNKPILEVLSDPDQVYFKTLAKFKVKRSYANVANDRTVPYWTAGMEIMDYFYESKGKLDITLDKKYSSVITAYDIKAPAIISPFFFILAFSAIGIQGLISRYRVSGLLQSGGDMMPSVDSEHTTLNQDDRLMDGDLLAGALDAVNLPGDSSPPLKHSNSYSDQKSILCHSPGKCLAEKAKPLPLDPTTLSIHKNLNLLDWEKVYVYIRAFNAHGSIVCREKRFTVDAGEATIQHFIDTTQLS
ncbi:putative serine esterase-domain-containing protein [Mucor mucedo]|uniref:putative serine esterase-domain-containing protein n=1 Tax=Mucor mucedo TaxID=29922 RepID=UPI00221F539A|nr:putative serine esterase-domain-containing protein [Mucor mucedo]KAI7874337.1 putative serine esterase-domain-containing protein [Mucor mucedo]